MPYFEVKNCEVKIAAESKRKSVSRSAGPKDEALAKKLSFFANRSLYMIALGGTSCATLVSIATSLFSPDSALDGHPQTRPRLALKFSIDNIYSGSRLYYAKCQFALISLLRCSEDSTRLTKRTLGARSAFSGQFLRKRVKCGSVSKYWADD